VADAIRQDQQRQSLIDRLGVIRRRAVAHQGELTAEQLLRVPSFGGWSVGVVFEHLCIAEDSYHAPMDRVIARAVPDGRAATATWQPSIMGNLLVRSFRSPRKMTAPSIYQPSPQPRNDVVGEYLKRVGKTLELLDRAGSLFWQKVKLSSPVTRIIRLNLGDAFEVIVTHAERHLSQVERIREAMGK
jgi:hypothetical protein